MIEGIDFVPKVFVFDLDDTLWVGEVDCTGGPPFTNHGSHVIRCQRGRQVKLFTDVPEIIRMIYEADVHVAYASRTWEPEWAKHALSQFIVNSRKNVNMWSICRAHGWGDIGKTHHFREIKKTTGFEYHDMMFFDNEQRNIREIEKLGAHCVYCPDGLTKDDFVTAVREYDRKRRNACR